MGRRTGQTIEKDVASKDGPSMEKDMNLRKRKTICS